MIRDPGWNRRLRQALLIAAVCAAFVGGLAFIAEPYDLGNRSFRRIVHGANAGAITFWIAFGAQYWTRVRKSPAVLDFERRVRFAEELFRRRRHSRTSDSAAEMIRSSMPGAKGTGQP